jgi:hypothetical protein
MFAAIPPCLVAGEQLGRSVAVDIGERPPIGVAEDEAPPIRLGSASSTD